jgi:hypothetical protein
MNKVLLAFIFGIMLLGLVSAGEAGENIGTYKQNSCVKLPQICADCTYSNISSIVSPNQTIYGVGDSYTKNGTFFNYTFCNTSELGNYKVNGIFNPSGTAQVFSYVFDISPSGNILSTSQSIVSQGFFVILLLIIFAIPFFINKLPSSNTRDEEGRIVQINYLKYLRSALWFVEYMIFVTIIYIASNLSFNYLGDELLHKVFFTFFQILLGLALPIVILWFIWIVSSFLEDKKFKELLNRGIFPEGRI